MTACSVVTVTGFWSSGAAARLTSEVSDAVSSKYEVTEELCANVVNFTRACWPDPSSLLSSIKVASPAAVWDGSGRSTRRSAGALGPPTERGSSSRQPYLANCGVRTAAACGITIINGDLATLNPAGSTVWAPGAKPRTTSTHRLESGIQALICPPVAFGCWPSIWPAATDGEPESICTATQRPSTWCCSRLYADVMSWMGGVMSVLTATVMTSGLFE